LELLFVILKKQSSFGL